MMRETRDYVARMKRGSPQAVEASIRRLAREIQDIDNLFYALDQNEDRFLFLGMLERKRDDMVRSAVLQMHTSIEDLLNSLITCCVLKAKPENRLRRIRSKSGQALRKMLFGGGSLGFDMKLNFARALGLIDETTKDKLTQLNTLRNKCSHNWLLKATVRHGRRPRQKKPPLLLYKGADLHKLDVLKEFSGEYVPIYLKLFMRYMR